MRALFSMPLAYPSTLDRRPRCSADASYVEGLWSPSLGRSVEKRRQKQTLLRCRLFARDVRGVFLSQAGPRVDLGFLKLGIILSLSILFASETTKATRRVASRGAVMPLAA